MRQAVLADYIDEKDEKLGKLAKMIREEIEAGEVA